MCPMRILLVWCPKPNMAIDNDHGRSSVFLLKGAEGPRQFFHIVGVIDIDHIPSVGSKTCAHIFTKRQCGLPLNGDLVIIVNPTQIR